MRTINSEAFKVLKEYAIEGNCKTLREFVECDSQSDPGFFRWFFQDNDLEDFENPNPKAFEDWLNDNDVHFTFDVFFEDGDNSNNKGFSLTKQECIEHIKEYNGTDERYFADYKGGEVSVVCNETGDVYYSEAID